MQHSTYWKTPTQLETRGFRRVDGGRLAAGFWHCRGIGMIGYAFDEAWASTHPGTIDRFLDASQKAKQILLTSDAESETDHPAGGGARRHTLKIYRDRYREGVPRRSVDAEEDDARILYGVLLTLGGPALVGQGTNFAHLLQPNFVGQIW